MLLYLDLAYAEWVQKGKMRHTQDLRGAKIITKRSLLRTGYPAFRTMLKLCAAPPFISCVPTLYGAE